MSYRGPSIRRLAIFVGVLGLVVVARFLLPSANEEDSGSPQFPMTGAPPLEPPRAHDPARGLDPDGAKRAGEVSLGAQEVSQDPREMEALGSTTTRSTSEVVEELAASYFDALREHRVASVEIESIVRQQPDDAIAALLPFSRDDVAFCRHRALSLLAHAARRSNSSEAREQVAAVLVEALEDVSLLVANGAAADLYLLEPADFSAPTKQLVSDALGREEPSFDVILLAGYLYVSEAEDRLLEIKAVEPSQGPSVGVPYYRTAHWAATLSLARLGDSNALAEVRRRVVAEPDDTIRATTLLDHLGYTQREGSFRLLELYLSSDSELPPVDGGLTVSMAQHAMAVLARWFPGFPSDGLVSPRTFDSESIDAARVFLSDPLNWRAVGRREGVYG